VSAVGTDSTTAAASSELRFAPLLDQAAALRDGSTTSLALVTEVQAAADRLDPEIGTYVVRFDQQARQAAAAADEARARGTDTGLLHGIPFGVKDILASREGPTTAQSAALDPGWGDQPEGPVLPPARRGGDPAREDHDDGVRRRLPGPRPPSLGRRRVGPRPPLPATAQSLEPRSLGRRLVVGHR